MTKKFHTLSIVLLTGLSSVAQNAFQTVIGEELQSYQEEVFASVPASDGGVIAGIWNDESLYVMKTDPDGQPLWSFIYTTNAADASPAVQGLLATSDGGAYVIVDARTESPGPSDYEFVFVLTRIDANGDMLWSKRYRCSEDDYYIRRNSMALLQNDDLQLSWYANGGSGAPDFTMRISANGDHQWAKKQIQASSMTAGLWYDIHVGSDNGVVLARVAHGEILHPICVSSWAQDGTLLWNKTVRMTNASWDYYTGKSLLTGSGDIFIHARQFAPTVQPNDYPLLVKINALGELQWYRLYGTGNSQPYWDEHSAVELPNTNVRFGALGRSTFTTDGAHVSSVSITPPGWTAGSYAYSFFQKSILQSEEHVLVQGSFRRLDNTFGTTWTTPFLGRIDLTAPLNCGWTEATSPLLPDTIVPSEFITYQDDTPWAMMPVSMADTVVFALPFSLPTSVPYCAPVGISETDLNDVSVLSAIPNLAIAGTSISVRSSERGALCLLDHSGRLLRTINLSAGSSHAMATNDLSPGMYILLLNRDDGKPSLKARLVIE